MKRVHKALIAFMLVSILIQAYKTHKLTQALNTLLVELSDEKDLSFELWKALEIERVEKKHCR